MPAYRWTCHACGDANPGDATACAACRCPASATAATIAAHRAAFLASGGRLQAAVVLPSGTDLSAFDVLVRPLLYVLTGWWPPRLSALRAERR